MEEKILKIYIYPLPLLITKKLIDINILLKNLLSRPTFTKSLKVNLLPTPSFTYHWMLIYD